MQLVRLFSHFTREVSPDSIENPIPIPCETFSRILTFLSTNASIRTSQTCWAFKKMAETTLANRAKMYGFRSDVSSPKEVSEFFRTLARMVGFLKNYTCFYCDESPRVLSARTEKFWVVFERTSYRVDLDLAICILEKNLSGHTLLNLYERYHREELNTCLRLILATSCYHRWRVTPERFEASLEKALDTEDFEALTLFTRLLKSDPDYRRFFFEEFVRYGIHLGRMDILKFCIRENKDAIATEPIFIEALYLAIYKVNCVAVKMLLSAGVDPNRRMVKPTAVNQPLRDRIAGLFSHLSSYPYFQNPSESALSFAASHGNSKIRLALINSGSLVIC